MGERKAKSAIVTRTKLVSVVIPVFNGAETIQRTLESAVGQTYPYLEIVVVDDGSTDATSQIILGFAQADHRITVIRQPNSGVAAARNRGIRAATGSFIAPLDADDIWLPTNIEKQVSAVEGGNARAVLCYSWSERIDPAGTVIAREPGLSYVADALSEICRGNFIGNGSSVLMRRDAVVSVGGYDPSLRERGHEGCEDFLLYFRLARIGSFAVVPEYLVQYRAVEGSMSSDPRRMLRSWLSVRDEICALYPESSPGLAQNILSFLTWLYRGAVARRRWRDAAFIAREIARRDLPRSVNTMIRETRSGLNLQSAILRSSRAFTAHSHEQAPRRP